MGDASESEEGDGGGDESRGQDVGGDSQWSGKGTGEGDEHMSGLEDNEPMM